METLGILFPNCSKLVAMLAGLFSDQRQGGKTSEVKCDCKIKKKSGSLWTPQVEHFVAQEPVFALQFERHGETNVDEATAVPMMKAFQIEE